MKSTLSSPKKSTGVSPASVMAGKDGMIVCPGCRKSTAPRFMWHFDDETCLCLVCYHKTPEQKENNQVSTLKSESKSAGFVMKAVGGLLLVFGILIGSICLFYKPHTTKVEAKVTATDAKLGDKKPGAGKHRGGGGGGESEKDASGKPTQEATDIAKVAGPKGDGKPRMAPTVNALIAQLPNKKGAAQAADTDKAASTVKGLLDKANNVADAMKSDDKNAGPGAPQGEKTAAQLEKEKAKDKMKANAAKTKDVALSMAASLIQKNDADGSKSAEALAQLGKVSTVFADVATKVTDGAITASPGSSAQYDISAGGGAHGAASKRLEGDVLESQGNSGYDPMEAVRRELDEAAGGATKTTISTSTDPNAPKSQATVQALAGAAGLGGAQGRVGRASGTGGAMVKDAEALAMSSLPAAFSSAARRTTGQGTTNPTASHGGNERLSCFVLSMRGDLLFDFNSAELRSDSATALAQVAQVVTEHPNLPLLVRGYTDSKGGYEANEALSRRRAEAVRDWIMAKTGIKAQKITVQGLGSTEPVAPNEYVDGSDNPGGREKNRRVTVTIPRDQVEQ